MPILDFVIEIRPDRTNEANKKADLGTNDQFASESSFFNNKIFR